MFFETGYYILLYSSDWPWIFSNLCVSLLIAGNTSMCHQLIYVPFFSPSLAAPSSSSCPSCSRNEPSELLQARLLSYMPSTYWIIFKCLNSSQPQMSVNHGLWYCSKGFQSPRLPVCPSHCIQDSVQGRLPPHVECLSSISPARAPKIFLVLFWVILCGWRA